MVTTCDQVTAGPITFENNGKVGTMSMTILNPNPYDITASDLHVVWNSTTGGPNDTPLSLQTAILVDFLQTVNDGSGDLTILPASPMIMPANATSIVIFTFNQEYQNTGGESIVINLSTPGCESYPIHNP